MSLKASLSAPPTAAVPAARLHVSWNQAKPIRSSIPRPRYSRTSTKCHSEWVHGGQRSAPISRLVATAAADPASAPTSNGASAAPSAATDYIANLLVRCPDAKGVVASLSQLLYGMNCNIVSSDQFSDLDENQFYQRISLQYGDMLVGAGNTAILEKGIAEVAARFNMDWRICYKQQKKRVAIMVSKMDHCLYDLMIRHEAGELDCDIPIIISNWPNLAPVAAKFGLDFRCLPLDPKVPGAKAAQEAQLEALLEEMGIDVIVLARYMQIFSEDFAQRNWRRTISEQALFPCDSFSLAPSMCFNPKCVCPT